jgi:hypothetical protein
MSIEPARRLKYYFNESLRSWRHANAVAKQLGWPSPVGNPLAANKKSNTLFVLGSGASVLTFSDDEWQTIASNDSLGFNYWMLHPFVPSNYMFEMTTDEEDLTRILHNVSLRRDYKGTPIHVKDIERCFGVEQTVRYLASLPPNIGPIRPIWDAELPEGSFDMFCRTLVWFNRLGGFSGKGPWAAPRNRATLFLAVSLAVRAGYRSVVLGGVDLNNADYFFHASDFSVQPGLQVPPVYRLGRIHKTNDPMHGEVTISVLLDALDRIVLQPRGVRLFVAKRTSALYPRFPAYFDRERPAFEHA